MSDDLTLHAHLIGRQGSRADLNTPVLVIDQGALDRNIATMAALAAAHGVALRPHAKTHKSVDIARRQRDAGACGLCCAQNGEAGAMAAERKSVVAGKRGSVLVDIGGGRIRNKTKR